MIHVSESYPLFAQGRHIALINLYNRLPYLPTLKVKKYGQMIKNKRMSKLLSAKYMSLPEVYIIGIAKFNKEKKHFFIFILE